MPPSFTLLTHFPPFRTELGGQLERLAIVLGQAAKTLSDCAKNLRNGQLDEGALTAFLQNGKINGTLPLNGDERIWSFVPESSEGGN